MSHLSDLFIFYRLFYFGVGTVFYETSDVCVVENLLFGRTGLYFSGNRKSKLCFGKPTKILNFHQQSFVFDTDFKSVFPDSGSKHSACWVRSSKPVIERINIAHVSTEYRKRLV